MYVIIEISLEALCPSAFFKLVPVLTLMEYFGVLSIYVVDFKMLALFPCVVYNVSCVSITA